MSTHTFRVAGMHCDHCVRAVTEELEKLPGIRDVAVDLESGTVALDADGPVDGAAVAAAVDEAGYELAG